MRTQDEVLEKVQGTKSLFGFNKEVWVDYLDFQHAKSLLKEEFLNEEDAEKQWEAEVSPLTKEQVRKDMADYMKFAWTKAEDHRGLSASRSVEKIGAWLWLLGDEETIKAFEAAPYEQYGCPQLAVVCKAYELPIPSSVAITNMINGDCCSPGCGEGCGS